MKNSVDKIKKTWASKNKIKELKGALSVEDIAKSIGMEKGSLSHIVQGTVNIYLHRIVQIADAIGCKPAELLPLEWQNDIDELISNNADIEKELDHIKDIIETLEYWLNLNKDVELSPKDKASLVIALFKETFKLPKEEQAQKIEDLTQFFINTKAS